MKLLLSLCLVVPLLAQTPAKDLTQISLEDLMKIQVTSVSKKEQPLSKAGAAVFVISQEDIRRSGANNLPDILRMAPGVTVEQVNANTWSIGIRGFNGLDQNKILVLIDGRSVYRPSFSAVNWDELDVPLEDIERIEVIRGPGGTVWGANAVNGVINIITKTAQATEGGLVSTTAGSERGEGTLQYGGKLGGIGAYRAFGRYSNTPSSESANGGNAGDPWQVSHGGFRADMDLSAKDALTLEGDYYRAREREPIATVLSNAVMAAQTFNAPADYVSGSLLGRWTRKKSRGSVIELQVYDEYYQRQELGRDEHRNTLDVELQYRIKFGARNDVVWGGDYRLTSDRFQPGFSTLFIPARRSDKLYSAFVQDEIRLRSNLSLSVGSKIEWNSYTGYESEPSAQLVWTPTERQTVWFSAGRAHRQPSRADEGLRQDLDAFRLPDGTLAVETLTGTPNTKVERLNALDFGYRAQLFRKLSFDVAGFNYHYRDLATQEPQTPFLSAGPGPVYLVLPYVTGFLGRARSYGGEAYATWSVTDRWRVTAGYSRLAVTTSLEPSSRDTSLASVAGDSPMNRFEFRSFANLSRRLEWDASAAYTGSEHGGQVPAYVRVDTRLGLRWSEKTDLSLIGRNLLGPRHSEAPDQDGILHTLVERSIAVRLTCRF